MKKKYQFSGITTNKDYSTNNKSSLIPHPKSNIMIETPIIYKKEKILMNPNNSITNTTSSNNSKFNIFENIKDENANNKYLDLYQNLNNSLEGLFFNLPTSPINKQYKQNVSLFDSSENNNNQSKIETKLNTTKEELSNIKEKIDDVNKKMIKMKKILDKLKSQKSQTEKEIENLVSNKETLEEMYNTEIIMLMNEQQNQQMLQSNNENDIDNFSSSNIKVSIEEIQEMDIVKFKNDVSQLIKVIYNTKIEEKKKEKNKGKISQVLNIIDQTYQDFNIKTSNVSNININEVTNNFFFEISRFISSQSQNKFSISSINSLIHYLVKINYISRRIDKSMKFLQKHYNIKKKKIDEELIDLTRTLLTVENQKHELLLDLNSSSYKEKIENSPKNDTERLENNNMNNKNDNNNNNSNLEKSANITEIKNSNFRIENNSNLNINNSISHNRNTLFENDTTSTKINQNHTFFNDTISNINANENFNGGNEEIEKSANVNLNLNQKMQNLLEENLSNVHKTKNRIYDNYIHNGINLNRFKNKPQNFSEVHNHNVKQRHSNLNDDFGNVIKKVIISSSFAPSSQNNSSANGIKTIYVNSSHIYTNPNQNNGNEENSLITPDQMNNKYINNSCLNNKNGLKLSRGKKLDNNSNNSIFNNYSMSISQSKHQNKKYLFLNSETFSSIREKKEQRFTKFEKYLVRSITNSSNDFHKYYNSMVNINTDNGNFFKGYQNKNNQNNQNSVLMINNSNRDNSNKSLKKQNKKNNIYIDNIRSNYSILQNKIKKISNYTKRKYRSANNNTINNNEIKINGHHSPKHELDNQLKIFTKGSLESFCYFKILTKSNENKFNPLDNYPSISPEYSDYLECYLSIDVISGCLKISPNIPINRLILPKLNTNSINIVIYSPYNNDSYNTSRTNEYINKKFCINIKLKDLINIQMEKYMNNIVKIHSALLKNTTQNGGNMISNFYKNQNSKPFNINKLIYIREINEIHMEQNEKIRAALCNFFSFSLVIGKNSTKIDFVFINFDQFNVWLNTFDSIVNNNLKSTKRCVLSNKNSFVSRSKINNSSEKLKAKHRTINIKYKSSNDKTGKNYKYKNIISTTTSKAYPIHKKISFYNK